MKAIVRSGSRAGRAARTIGGGAVLMSVRNTPRPLNSVLKVAYFESESSAFGL